MAATAIFPSYEAFALRDDKSINGVDPLYAEKNPDFERYSNANTGCWNCYKCYACHNCEYCRDCTQCRECRYCKMSVEAWGLWFCTGTPVGSISIYAT